MDKHVISYLKARPELLQFVRKHPIWYRYLSRNPAMIKKLEQDAKVFYGQTLSQKIQNVHDRVQLAVMLLQFVEAMND